MTRKQHKRLSGHIYKVEYVNTCYARINHAITSREITSLCILSRCILFFFSIQRRLWIAEQKRRNMWKKTVPAGFWSSCCMQILVIVIQPSIHTWAITSSWMHMIRKAILKCWRMQCNVFAGAGRWSASAGMRDVREWHVANTCIGHIRCNSNKHRQK